MARASESVFQYQFEKEVAKSETALAEKEKTITRQRTTRYLNKKSLLDQLAVILVAHPQSSAFHWTKFTNSNYVIGMSNSIDYKVP